MLSTVERMLPTLEPLPEPPPSLWRSAQVYDYVCRNIEERCFVIVMGFIRGRKSGRSGMPSMGNMADSPEALVWALWHVMYRAKQRFGELYDLFIAPAPRLLDTVAENLREHLVAWRAGNTGQWAKAVELFETEDIDDMLKLFVKDPLNPRWRPFVAKWVAAEKKCARPVTCWFADIDLLGERHSEPVVADPERAREVAEAVLDALQLELEVAMQTAVPRRWVIAVVETLEGATELWRRETLTLYTGGGLQLLFPLPRPIDPRDPVYGHVATALKVAIRRACEKAGVQADRFSDPRASYLRAPGSINVKRWAIIRPIAW